MSQYQCPQCKSNRVRVCYPDIQCLDCGWSEPLIDFPISWDCHRAYCVEYGRPDPGPYEVEQPEGNGKLDERVTAIENQLMEIKVKPKHTYGVDYV